MGVRPGPNMSGMPVLGREGGASRIQGNVIIRGDSTGIVQLLRGPSPLPGHVGDYPPGYFLSPSLGIRSALKAATQYHTATKEGRRRNTQRYVRKMRLYARGVRGTLLNA